MLTIRLTRKGKKNQPFFRVVLIDKRRSSKGGRAVEDLGFVDPLTKRKNFKKERVQYWLSKGAQPSATIHNYLVSEKIIEGKKMHVSKIGKKKQAEINTAAKAKADEDAAKKLAAEAKPVDEKPAEEAKPASAESSGEAKPEEPAK